MKEATIRLIYFVTDECLGGGGAGPILFEPTTVSRFPKDASSYTRSRIRIILYARLYRSLCSSSFLPLPPRARSDTVFSFPSSISPSHILPARLETTSRTPTSRVIMYPLFSLFLFFLHKYIINQQVFGWFVAKRIRRLYPERVLFFIFTFLYE